MGQWINRVLNLLIILMIIILLGITYTAVTIIQHEFKPNFSVSRYLWQVEEENYDDLVEVYYSDAGFYLPEASANDLSLKNLATYADAVFWERIFQENNLAQKAEKQTLRKTKAASDLGMFSGEQKKIDQLYGSSNHASDGN